MKLLLIILVSLLASQITLYIVKKYQFNTIRVSSGLTLIFLLLMESVDSEISNTLCASFLGSTFLGMSNQEIFSERDLVFVSLIFSLIFYFVLPFNIGLGGALGTSAFVSCAIIRLSYKLSIVLSPYFIRMK